MHEVGARQRAGRGPECLPEAGQQGFELASDAISRRGHRITSYNVCYTKLLRIENAIFFC